jgi:hypothetical protein
MSEENDPQTQDSEAVAQQQVCSNRLEALRLKLCSIGLHPLHHETPEKAAEAICAMIAYFRRENLDPSHYLQCAVLRKLRVFGYMEEGDPSPLYQLVPYPNNPARHKATTP